MNKLAITALLFTLTSTAFAGDLILSVTGHQEIVYKKVAKKKFEKISSTNVGVQSIDYVTERGTKNLGKQEINVADSGQSESLEVTGKNIVKIVDAKEQISTEVEATVDATILGNVKAINIDGKVMESVYAEAYKKAGLDELKNLNILGGAITSKINVSDLNCVADGDLLKCDQDSEFKFTMSGI